MATKRKPAGLKPAFVDPTAKVVIPAVTARESDPKSLKDDIDMAVVTNTSLRGDISAEDANIINDMYMVLCRVLKLGSGDAKLITDAADVVKRYREAGR